MTTVALIPEFTDKEHSELLENHKKQLLEYVSLEGEQNGKQGRPNSSKEFDSRILNYIETSIQQDIEMNQERFLPISGMVIAKQIQTEAQAKIQELTNIRNGLEHTLRQLQEQQDSVRPDLSRMRWRMLAMLGMGFIAIADGSLAYPGFRYAALSTPAAIIASAAVTAGIFFGAHFLGGYIKKAITSMQRRMRTALTLTPFATGFYLLGVLRAKAYNHIPAYTSPSTSDLGNLASAWSIAVVSFLLFWLALYLSVQFYRTKQERESEELYLKLKTKVDKVKQQMKDIGRNISKIEADAKAQSGLALAKYEYALSCEYGLVAFAKHAAEAYKASNLRHRTDNICPDFFSTIAEFNFKTFFDKAKTNKK